MADHADVLSENDELITEYLYLNLTFKFKRCLARLCLQPCYIFGLTNTHKTNS